MNIRKLSDTYSVSPQIDVEDVPAILAAGFGTIICNRPDAEVPPSHSAEAIEAAAFAAGLNFVRLPVTHQTLTQDIVDAQAAAIRDADAPVLAYCASGTRSSIVWSYGQVGQLSTDKIIAATTQAGYDLGGMRAALDRMAGN